MVVGIVGLGSLGHGLLRALDAGGTRVIGVDSDPAVVERARTRAGTAEVSDRFERLGAADVVIEAVSERADVKRDVLRRLGEVCPRATVLVTTTASLSVPALAIASGRPAHLVGLRFALPLSPRAGAGLVRTTLTAPETVSAAEDLLSLLGLAVAPPGVDAPVARTLLLPYLRRAVALHEEGYASAEDIDTAMRLGCGLPAGPLEMVDAVGVDTVYRELDDLHRRTGLDHYRPPLSLERMIAGDRLGRKSGQGYHAYDEAGRRVVPDPRGRPSGQVPAVGHVGIVGTGTMARGIAHALALAGVESTLTGRTAERAESAREAIGSSLERAVKRGRLDPEAARSALARVRTDHDLTALADCDLVIEAVAEDISVKRSVFEQLDKVCRPGAVLATSTSSLSVAECAAATDRPEDVIGMHFFNPAQVMRLVEVVRTEATNDAAHATAHALCERLGKTAVDCTDRTGFIVNFLLFPYLNHAVRTLELSGSLGVEELDTAVESLLGFPLGPFALLDTVGLDVSLAILQRLHETFRTEDFDAARSLYDLVDMGHLGRKTGTGFRRP
ncbi:3-hydroxyacyl-CoA dehydrogenase family protein [Streptomyces sp. CA-278952]|uniref:3-hydroxyacyl-CoA dehydrogenase family protein n=1 Tax=Streptomyces sp. CA-278952 TaxID=2980556 RepID=UPI0023686436|nr:3-hydroxyacyl-CoA dehydrogenase family protein [Streptomyces sp. CA-278952]WDG31694.1 3-hydroxyacyl-CoA dehydrogenase family protein [Streptomyces sp. CA-278952]